MDQTAGGGSADQQIAEAVAAEHESLSPECRADAARLGRLLAPDFPEFGASGAEYGYEGTAEMVAAAMAADDEPVTIENMRGWLLGVEIYVDRPRESWRRTEAGHWQMFHHQGTLTAR